MQWQYKVCALGLLFSAAINANGLHFNVDPNTIKGGYSYITDPTGTFDKVHKFSIKDKCGNNIRDLSGMNIIGEMEDSDCGENSVRSEIYEEVWEDNLRGDIQPVHQWYSWNVYLPENFPIQETGKLLLGQFHNGECPHVSFTSRGSKWLDYAEDEDTLHFETMKLWYGDCESVVRKPIIKMSELRGKWSHFVLEMHWAGAREGNGLAKMWIDGELVLDYKGRTLTPQKEDLNFMKVGVYQCCNEGTILPADAMFTTPEKNMKNIFL